MNKPLCTRERIRRWPEPDGEVWHVVSPQREMVEGDFHPIKCSTSDGIVLPGPPERRDPTCPDCIGKRLGVSDGS